MATTTRRRAPSRSRRAPARRAPARGRKRPPPRRRPAKKKSGPNPVIQGVKWTYVHLRTMPPEVWGAVVAFAALIAGLGVYAAGAGPVGGMFRYIGTLMVGRLVVVFPLLLLAAGAFLIVGKIREHGPRILIGSIVTTFALAAMVHLARGPKPITAPIERLRRMGGIFGALLARPLADLIGLWATWLRSRPPGPRRRSRWRCRSVRARPTSFHR